MKFLLLWDMFGEVYKIEEAEIPNLAKTARQRSIAITLITLTIAFSFVAYSLYPLIIQQGPTFVIPMLLPGLIVTIVILRRRKNLKPEEMLRAYELTIADGSIHCKYAFGNSIKNISISFSEIGKITHYIKGSVLVVGTDLSHSFSIPANIEKREEVMLKLSAIKPIDNAGKEIRIYYMQRVNMAVFMVGALLVVTTEIKTLLGLACIAVLYSTSLPVYFFITTRKMPQHVKLINGIFLLMAFIVLMAGILKILNYTS